MEKILIKIKSQKRSRNIILENSNNLMEIPRIPPESSFSLNIMLF